MNEPTLAHYVKNLAIAKQALVEAEAAVDDAKRDRRLAEGQLIAVFAEAGIASATVPGVGTAKPDIRIDPDWLTEDPKARMDALRQTNAENLIKEGVNHNSMGKQVRDWIEEDGELPECMRDVLGTRNTPVVSFTKAKG